MVYLLDGSMNVEEGEKKVEEDRQNIVCSEDRQCKWTIDRQEIEIYIGVRLVWRTPSSLKCKTEL